MNVIEQENWAYALFHDEAGGDYYLETVCGTVGIYTLTVKLTAEEIAAMTADPNFVKDLAQRITYSPTQFMERRVPDFEPDAQ